MPRSEMLLGEARKAIKSMTKNTPQVQLAREKDGNATWVPGVLLGLGAGVVAGLLLAPQKGEQTRTLVQDTWTEYSKDLPQRTSSALNSARSIADRFMGTTPRRAQKTRKRVRKQVSARKEELSS
jgi:gas vesicle protein